jgi:hypothetical protein
VGEYAGGEFYYRGQKHDIKNNPFSFDGREEHGAYPYTGVRYSLVYYFHKQAALCEGQRHPTEPRAVERFLKEKNSA